MGQTHSVNFSSDHKLINFNVPIYLIKNFDNLMKFKRVSRTSMLIHLMEGYLRSEQQKLKDDKHLNDLVVGLKSQNKKEIKEELKTEWEPPMIPNSSDFNDWEDRLNTL